ncbi:MAG TPA: DNA topoisomerase VI subunit B [Anaerohalosphaeraceae bacterium]|jgi:DNA topoisomerase-6 subunit B|nr:DNA topoisomerase VI subunit B [Anaerohalosphaeraceae bacterium]HRT50043.1 DNA topoisomerase VI subunit B [Anaerohalosphaeraceae bacterium]HRT85846.1 DNA topoisomerase VI subunit B [Anaerohalosphaeraceae bacterium]
MEAQKTAIATQMSFEFGEENIEDMASKAKETKTKTKRRIVETSVGKKPVETAAAQSVVAVEPQAATEPSGRRRRRPQAATAESMAAKQRDISVSEFFAKNRHLLGFDNPRKALLTAVKEAVDNSLDACEEAQIMPKLWITITAIEGTDNKFRLNVTDNGPGIVKHQVPNIFARLLYGSKFHTLKMSRGQQGIGISAAGMYGLLTTGEPVQIITRTNPKKPAQHYHVQIDTTRNKPDVVLDEECEFDLPTGTSVTITLEGRYQKGKQSVDDYIAQTAMANPHATIVYRAPDGNTYEYPATSNQMPFIPVEIKPHPYGVEIGVLYKMARESSSATVSEFLRSEFSRISPRLAADIVKTAKLSARLKPRQMTLKDAERLHKAINETKIMAPSSDCIGPIGQENLEDGLCRVVEAEFYTSCTRKPAVYRGNPFLVEAALAYGFKDETEDNGKGNDDDREPLMRLSRIANRVPLLYQQSACAIYKAVLETSWRSYGLSQSKGALPRGPVMLMVHIASVWVPFTSESKEAIAHYPEIIKEIKLAVQECGRRLGMHVRRQRRIRDEMVKRNYIETYLPHIGEALRDILTLKEQQVETVVARLKETLERSRKL